MDGRCNPEGKLQVRRTIAYVPKKGLVISEPKTSKSHRSVHLTAIAVEALKRHRIRQNEMRLTAGDWVFCNSVGKPIDGSHLLRLSFRPLLKKPAFLLFVFMMCVIVLLHYC